jgi:hypothetical protein
MNENYSYNVYNQLVNLDSTFSSNLDFNSFDEAVSTNESYAKSIYSYLSSKDKSFSANLSEEDFIKALKKKEDSQSPLVEEPTVSTTEPTQEPFSSEPTYDKSVDDVLQDEGIRLAIQKGILLEEDIRKYWNKPTYEIQGGVNPRRVEKPKTQIQQKVEDDVKAYMYRPAEDFESEIERQDLRNQSPYRKSYSEDSSFIEDVFGSGSLAQAGIDYKDFDGFLNSRGLKDKYLKRKESGVYDDNKLLEESDASQLLDLYLEDKKKRSVMLQELEDQKSTGLRPSLYDKKFKPQIGIDQEKIYSYINNNMPTLMESQKKRAEDMMRKVEKASEEGDNSVLWEDLKPFTAFKESALGTTASALDLFGADSQAEKIRGGIETREFKKTPLHYTTVSVRKATVDGTEYIVSDDGQVYDTNLKINVSSVLPEGKINKIKKASESSRERSRSTSGVGLGVEFGNVVGDLAFQIAFQALVTRGVGAVGAVPGAVGRGASTLVKSRYGMAMVSQGMLGASRGFEETLKQARAAGISEEEARDLASDGAIQMGALYAVTSVLNPRTEAVNAVTGVSSKISNALNSYKTMGKVGFVKNLSAKTLEVAKEIPREGFKEFVQENVQQAGEVFMVNRSLNERAKQNILRDTMTVDDLISTSILSFAAGGLMPGAGSLSSNTVSAISKKLGMFSDLDKVQALAMLSNNRDAAESAIKMAVRTGAYTEQQAKDLLADIDVFASTVNRIPKNISPEQQMETMRLLNEISITESEKSQLDPMFHEDLNKQIEQKKQEIRDVLDGKQVDKKPSVSPDVQDESISEDEVQEEEKTKSKETVGDVVNRPVTLTKLGDSQLDTPIQGDLYIEGQQVVVEDADGNITEIGNFDEIADTNIDDLGIEYTTSNVEVQSDGSLTVDNKSYTIQEDLPTQGIVFDDNGDVSEVSIKDESGKPVMFKGQLAEDIAYQILLNKATSQDQKQSITELLDKDEEFQRILREAQESPQETADQDTEQATESAAEPEQEVEEETSEDKLKQYFQGDENIDSKIKNVLSALKKLAPKVKIKVHKTRDQYLKAIGQEENAPLGTYKSQDKTIHLDPENLSLRTLYHETFHAILLSRLGTDKELTSLTNNMLKSISKVIDPRLKKQLERFATSKDSEGNLIYDLSVQSEEMLAELFGIMATNYDSLPDAQQSIIKRYLDKVAKFFGLKRFTDQEVIDLLNTLSKKVVSGDEITESDVNILREKSGNTADYGDSSDRSRVRTKPDPKKTIKAYKLFRVVESAPGQIFPLFVDANTPVEIGSWIDADMAEGYAFKGKNGHFYIPSTQYETINERTGKKEKRKTGQGIEIPNDKVRQELIDNGFLPKGSKAKKITALARRPGWHAGDMPMSTHLGGKSQGSNIVDTRSVNQIWAEVEIAADVDWQQEALNQAERTKEGKINLKTADITDRIPEDGYYKYKTNPNMTGSWIIGGSMKVNRILSDAEVAEINQGFGVQDLARTKPMNLAKYGFGDFSISPDGMGDVMPFVENLVKEESKRKFLKDFFEGKTQFLELTLYEFPEAGLMEKGFTEEQASKIMKELSRRNPIVRAYFGSQTETETEVRNEKVEKAIDLVRSSLSSIIPDIKIEGVSQERIFSETGRDDLDGVYFYESKEIFINLDTADPITVFHEAIHAFLYSATDTDNPLYDQTVDRATEKMVDSLKKFVDNDTLQKLNDHTKKYADGKKGHEFVAELGAILASEYESLSSKAKRIIRTWLDSIAKKLGIKRGLTDSDIFNSLKAISVAISKGEDLTKYDKSFIETIIQEEYKKNYIEDLFSSKTKFISLLSYGTPEAGLKRKGFTDQEAKAIVSEYYRRNPTGDFVNTEQAATRKRIAGDFEVSYFENLKDYKKAVDDGLVVNNVDIFTYANGANVAITQPDNMFVGDVKYNGDVIFEGQGGVFYVIKSGRVWANAEKGKAATLASYINESIDKDGVGRLLLVSGSTEKVLTSASGANAGFVILETLIDKDLIPKSDFRNVLKNVGKKYGIDFNGRDSAESIKKDIQDKFINDDQSTFESRRKLFSDFVKELASLESVRKNKDEIYASLGNQTSKSMSATGLRISISNILTENILYGIDTSNVYAAIEVTSKVKYNEDKDHKSYRHTIVTEDGSKPKLILFKERPHAVDSGVIQLRDGSKVEKGYHLGLTNIGIGRGKLSPVRQRVRSAYEYVFQAKDQGHSDADIRRVGNENGFSTSEINEAINSYEEEKRFKGMQKEGLFNPDGNFFEKVFSQAKRGLFSNRGYLGKSTQRFREFMRGEVAKNLKKAYDLNRDLKKALKKKSKEEVREVIDNLDKYMRGDKSVSLPSDVELIAYKMRVHVDELSRLLIKVGVAKKGSESEFAIKYNIGSYLYRSYEVFDNPDYKPTEPILEAAKVYLRKSLRAKAIEIAQKENNDPITVLEQMVDDQIESILNKSESNAYVSAASSKLGAKKTSLMNRRLEIPFEIRALMGEYTDPVLNYGKTIRNITKTVEAQKFANRLLANGEGLFLFKKPTGIYNVEIAMEGTKSMDPLDGWYTSPEIYAALEERPIVSFEPDSFIEKFYNGWLKGVGMAKYSKTILSIGTHAKNVTGNLFFMIYNGYSDPDVYKKTFNTLVKDFKGMTSEEQRLKLYEYTSMGIIGSSVTLEEIRSMIESDHDFDARMTMNNPNQRIRSKAAELGKKATRPFTEIYQAEDDIFKIVAYENENKRYSKALFDTDYNKLTPEQKREVNERTAEIVKNILPNYGRLGKIRDIVRALPVAGPFISFELEAWRTAYNMVDLAMNEMKDPRTKDFGKRRLKGVMAMTLIKGMIYNMFGIFGDDDDEEDDVVSDTRLFVAPWHVFGNLLVLSVDKGKIKFINVSSSDPHGSLDEALISILSGNTPAESFKNFLGQMKSGFFSADIFGSTIVEVLKNEDNVSGKPIYLETDSANEAVYKVFDKIAEDFEPGTVSSGRRIKKSYDEGGTKDAINEAVGQFTGFKIQEADIHEQMYFKSRDIAERVSENTRDYSSTRIKFEKGEKDITLEDVENAYLKANQSHIEIYSELTKYWDAGLRRDADPEKMIEAMKGARIPMYVIDAVIRGQDPILRRKH